MVSWWSTLDSQCELCGQCTIKVLRYAIGRPLPDVVAPSDLAPQLTPHGMCNVMQRDPTHHCDGLGKVRGQGKG